MLNGSFLNLPEDNSGDPPNAFAVLAKRLEATAFTRDEAAVFRAVSDLAGLIGKFRQSGRLPVAPLDEAAVKNVANKLSHGAVSTLTRYFLTVAEREAGRAWADHYKAKLLMRPLLADEDLANIHGLLTGEDDVSKYATVCALSLWSGWTPVERLLLANLEAEAVYARHLAESEKLAGKSAPQPGQVTREIRAEIKTRLRLALHNVGRHSKGCFP